MIWFQDLYKLQFITRYSNIPRIRDENVAQHSFFVTALCVEIYEEYNKKYRLDLGHLLLMATTHDWAESEIDDVAHNVKAKYPAVREALKEAEEAYMDKYPQYVIDTFKEYEECSTIHSKIVHLADALQCVQYTEVEVKMGNTHMLSVLNESYKRTKQLRKELDNVNS